MWFCSLHLSRAVDYKHAAPTGLCERTEGRSIPRCVSEVLSALRAGSRWTEAPPAGRHVLHMAMGHMCRSIREVSAHSGAHPIQPPQTCIICFQKYASKHTPIEAAVVSIGSDPRAAARASAAAWQMRPWADAPTRLLARHVVAAGRAAARRTQLTPETRLEPRIAP